VRLNTPGRRAKLGALLAVVVLLAGCRVDTTLTVVVRDDGSGTVRVRVTLDADAVRQAEAGGAKLEDRVRLADLSAADWTVSPWQRKPDGSATLVIRKPFTSPQQLTSVVEELSGERGPLRDVRLKRDSGLLTTSFDVSGIADLTQLTSGVLDDPDLVARLSAERVDLPALDQRLSQQLRESFRLRVVVRFPDGSRKDLTVEPGTQATIDASSSDLDATRAGLLATALLLGVLGIVILVRGEVSRARHHQRR
jgi:hypothetical protein